jgi:hypothetical protein|tara:strand:+ start:585 stop:749 length:165 start_codon:yes stop_codon:yes gene_type:complete
LNQSSGKNYLNVIPVTCDGEVATSIGKKEKETELKNKLNEQKAEKKKKEFEREE